MRCNDHNDIFFGQVDVSPMIKLGFALPPNVEIFEFLREGF